MLFEALVMLARVAGNTPSVLAVAALSRSYAWRQRNPSGREEIRRYRERERKYKEGRVGPGFGAAIMPEQAYN
jgi:hypothetical protein